TRCPPFGWDSLMRGKGRGSSRTRPALLLKRSRHGHTKVLPSPLASARGEGGRRPGEGCPYSLARIIRVGWDKVAHPVGGPSQAALVRIQTVVWIIIALAAEGPPPQWLARPTLREP